MSEDTRDSAVPSGRFTRMGKLGSLATRVATNMAVEGAKQLAQGKRPKARDLLLTPGNAMRVADQLAQLRGAAMKVGQLLSMDAGDLLPAELTDVLSRLRANGTAMPPSQLSSVLEKELGSGWKQNFIEFTFKPIAAASIGQVHSAHADDGTRLAVKVQYPGIRDSIDSDVNNVMTLLGVTGLIPAGVDYHSLLDEAKKQLHAESDYQLEARQLDTYREHLSGDSDFVLPDVYHEITSPGVLAMTYLEGEPIESLVDASQQVRDRVMHALLRLFFKEIFSFRLVQTDPNFANYLFNNNTGQLVLLDFGAARHYSEAVSDGYRKLFSAATIQDREAIADALSQIGFFSETILPEQKEAVVDIVMIACEPLFEDKAYDFGSSNLAARISEAGTALSMEQNYWHSPPADALFLHRKIGGMYLLAARLGASINVRELFDPYSVEP
ncbi:AarF/ABC1/UbiB kinase family protein [Parasalinivibrio latis]|uniref:ABC1 kinase family protein n=1 Tax=Parasalinivibrio latis TaxID=2952610 RepID=UPI0030E34E7F